MSLLSLVRGNGYSNICNPCDCACVFAALARCWPPAHIHAEKTAEKAPNSASACERNKVFSCPLTRTYQKIAGVVVRARPCSSAPGHTYTHTYQKKYPVERVRISAKKCFLAPGHTQPKKCAAVCARAGALLGTRLLCGAHTHTPEKAPTMCGCERK